MDSTVRRRPQDWMHLVGCALEEGIVKLARVKCPGVDLRNCASDADVMRAVVAAPKGDDALNGMKDEDVAKTFQSLSIVERERIVA
ncbi:hypothetical protein FKV24_001375 [Lysobacter maris]|uniref:Uncharacterized protein n=1 Tax=Marilutibacter maris TaxID=1605891 RepID=A0A508BBE0_9GAMM|nr:hypothetical protein [Lysobacter maris]KAB8198574.1 hypothetical protein FKV24_001375 [Lysobacter maris]